MGEVYYSGDVARAAYAHDAQPAELYAQLLEKFPWVKPEQYFSISEPAFHEVIGEPVITCNLPYPQSDILAGADAAMAARKFCMDSGTSYVRIYKLPTEPRPIWMPEGCTLFLIGKNFEEFGRPFNPLALTFEDYYFSGDLDLIEAHFALPMRRGTHRTYYGATLVNGQIARVKQYCYDAYSVFSDWDTVFAALCERHNRPDLL